MLDGCPFAKGAITMKPDFKKILDFSEQIIDFASGVPIVGTGVKTYRSSRNLLSALRTFGSSPAEDNDEFLHQHPLTLARLYEREHRLAGNLPYVEITNFVDVVLAGRPVPIVLSPVPGQFRLEPFADPVIEDLREAGFERLKEVGRVRRNSDIIRVEDIAFDGTTATLQIKKARYLDQARSNLILDFKPIQGVPTIRHTLLQESPGHLPKLADKRLANTLGVTILVFYLDPDGRLSPFIIPRSRQTAVHNRGQWSDSASGAAEWPEHPDGLEVSFENYIMDDVYNELKLEIGLNKDDLSFVAPLAICRELARAGKPQVFFIGFTHLGRNQLLAKMGDAIRRAKKNDGLEPVEIDEIHRILQGPRIDDLKSAQEAMSKLKIDTQCAASLHYCLTFLAKYGAKLSAAR